MRERMCAAAAALLITLALPAAAAPPRQTTVNIILKSFDSTGKAQFELQPVGTDPLPQPIGPHQTLIFENAPQGVGHNGINIDFVLIDQTGLGYTFPPQDKMTKAVSSQFGPIDGYPPQGISRVLKPTGVSGARNSVLSVYNPNQNTPTDKGTGTFSYILWVTRDEGKTFAPLDPGGQNNDGPTS
jgi:hypothetical protein